jgi:hypothetical protein
MELNINENFSVKEVKMLYSQDIDTIIFHENENNFSKIKKLGKFFYLKNPNIKIIINTICYNLSNLVEQNWISKIYINKIHFLDYINDKHYANFLAGFDDLFFFTDKEKITLRLSLTKEFLYKEKDIEHFLKLALMIKILNVEIINNNNFKISFSENVIHYKNNEYIYKNTKISNDLLFFTIL